MYEYYKSYLRSQDKYYREWLESRGIEPTNGNMNAIAHGHQSAVITYFFGEGTATIVGDIKESWSDDPKDSVKDQFNNEVGRGWGKEASEQGFGPDRIDEIAEIAFKNGDLTVDEDDPRLAGGDGGGSSGQDSLSTYEGEFGGIGGFEGSGTANDTGGSGSDDGFGGWGAGETAGGGPDDTTGGMETTGMKTESGQIGPTVTDDRGPHQIEFEYEMDQDSSPPSNDDETDWL